MKTLSLMALLAATTLMPDSAAALSRASIANAAAKQVAIDTVRAVGAVVTNENIAIAQRILAQGGNAAAVAAALNGGVAPAAPAPPPPAAPIPAAPPPPAAPIPAAPPLPAAPIPAAPPLPAAPIPAAPPLPAAPIPPPPAYPAPPPPVAVPPVTAQPATAGSPQIPDALRPKILDAVKKAMDARRSAITQKERKDRKKNTRKNRGTPNPTPPMASTPSAESTPPVASHDKRNALFGDIKKGRNLKKTKESKRKTPKTGKKHSMMDPLQNAIDKQKGLLKSKQRDQNRHNKLVKDDEWGD